MRPTSTGDLYVPSAFAQDAVAAARDRQAEGRWARKFYLGRWSARQLREEQDTTITGSEPDFKRACPQKRRCCIGMSVKNPPVNLRRPVVGGCTSRRGHVGRHSDAAFRHCPATRPDNDGYLRIAVPMGGQRGALGNIRSLDHIGQGNGQHAGAHAKKSCHGMVAARTGESRCCRLGPEFSGVRESLIGWHFVMGKSTTNPSEPSLPLRARPQLKRSAADRNQGLLRRLPRSTKRLRQTA